MFLVGEIVRPSGNGQTATWVEPLCGTVTEVRKRTVVVQWHSVAVEDELDFDEVVSTGGFQRRVPHHARILDGSDNPQIVTWYNEDGT